MKFIRPTVGMEYFRVRGTGDSRLEALSDGVFALAIAMLLVSTSVPTNFAELQRFVSDIVPFGICSVFLFWIWREHVRFFQRYGLTEDQRVMRLSFALTMLVPFFIYALKFLMGWLVGMTVGLVKLALGHPPAPIFTPLMEQVPMREVPVLMMIYSLGFLSIFTLFYVMYRHAMRHADELALSQQERFETLHTQRQHLLLIGTAACSILIAFVGYLTAWPWASFIAGFIYNGIAVGSVWLGKWRLRELAKMGGN
ncbi:MAG: TMEM175 family protein [Bacteroidota bacterium]